MKLSMNTCLFVALVLAACVAHGKYLLVQVDGTAGGSPRQSNCEPSLPNCDRTSRIGRFSTYFII